MRFLFPVLAVSLVVTGARASHADKGAVVTADCKTAVVASNAAGIGIRVVSGGVVPGMQAYVHDLPSTSAKPPDATFVAGLNVKLGIKPMNNTVAMVVVSADAASKFQLIIKKEKTAGGQNTASLVASEIGGKKLAAQDLVCTLTTADPVASCDDAHRPAACPGGGSPSCTAGKWECSGPPVATCDPGVRMAACPGGGAPVCTAGKWQCSGPPVATCDNAAKPVACPGGGALSCDAGQWKCAPLPRK